MKRVFFSFLYAVLACGLSSFSYADDTQLSNAAYPSVICVGTGCDPVMDTSTILHKGILDTAKETLDKRVNCTRNSQCKTITIDLCNQRHIMYSTFRARGVETALKAMVKARLSEHSTDPLVCTQWYNPPPKLQCVNRKCMSAETPIPLYQ